MFVRCLKCDKVMEPSVKCLEDTSYDYAWGMPSGGIVFRGGYNFGSAIVDALMDGVQIKIIVCDECIIRALDTGKALKVKEARNDTEIIVP